MTDRRLAGARPLEEVVRAAVRGGVTVVELREKECGAREFVALARRLREILAPAGIPLIINDRVDVALASGADGVHVGQSDMDSRDARGLLGPEAIVGLTVKTLEQAKQAENWGVSYLGVGPIFRDANEGERWGGVGRREAGRPADGHATSPGGHRGNRLDERGQRHSKPAPTASPWFRPSARRATRSGRPRSFAESWNGPGGSET